MRGPTCEARVGRVAAGELDIFFTPQGGCRGRRPVFLFHGQLRTAQDWNDPVSWPGSTRLAWTLAGTGLLVIAAYWGGPTWGNAAFRSMVADAVTVAESLGAAGDAYVAVGASHGALEALSLASHTPAAVAAGVGLIPAVNLGRFRDEDLAGARAYINTAYGLAAGSTSATVPLPADADPSVDVNAAAITAPFRFYGSAEDATAPWADVLALADRIGATAEDVSGSGHSDATIAAAPVEEITQFVYAHA